MYPARIIDEQGVTWWEGVLYGMLRSINVMATRPVFTFDSMFDDSPQLRYDMTERKAYFERYLPPEDGGPLYIYRVKK